jgi:hypothetical protein
VLTGQALLGRMRQTAMRRGALTDKKRQLRSEIAAALEAQGLQRQLAQRIAFQLVLKFNDTELGDHAVWRAVGQILWQEVARLRHHLGLGERQIVRVLPKLSARQVEDFLSELVAADRHIAWTIFDAAIEAAHPIPTGRRYLREYHAVVQQQSDVDPQFARTAANACFKAGAPRRKALERFNRA